MKSTVNRSNLIHVWLMELSYNLRSRSVGCEVKGVGNATPFISSPFCVFRYRSHEKCSVHYGITIPSSVPLYAVAGGRGDILCYYYMRRDQFFSS